MILHKGNEGAYAEELGGFFVIYSGNMDTRISNHDLQETVFHESTHVALEAAHATSAKWIQAQQADPGFITEYAKRLPTKEDIPESAIVAFVLLNHPGRLPAATEAAVRALIPNRIEYFNKIEGFAPNKSIAQWIKDNFRNTPSASTIALNADPDGDNFSNLLEYLFVCNPLLVAPPQQPTIGMRKDPVKNYPKCLLDISQRSNHYPPLLLTNRQTL